MAGEDEVSIEFVKAKPFSELEQISTLTEGSIIFDDGSPELKRLESNNLGYKVGSVAELRTLDGFEGVEVSLQGYYVSGDKASLTYKYTNQNFGSLVDDGGHIIKTTKGSWIAQFCNRRFDISDYGANITLADNKIFIDKAIAFAQSVATKDKRWTIYYGSRNGEYRSTGDHKAIRYVTFKQFTTTLILANPAGVTGYTIGEETDGANALSDHIWNVKGEYSLGKNSAVQPPDETYIGVVMINEYYSNIRIDQVTGFQKGVVFKGLQFGSSYNTIHIGLISNNNVCLELFGSNQGTGNPGWVNQNIFIGGSIRNSSSFVGSQTGVRFDSDSGYLNNSNVFHGIAFENFPYNQYESTTGDFVRAIDFRWAIQNTFYSCRFENILDNASKSYIAKESNTSQRNVISLSYGNINTDIENRAKNSYVTVDFASKTDVLYNILNANKLTDHIGIVDGVYRLSNDLGFVIRAQVGSEGTMQESLTDGSAISIGADYVNITNGAIGCDIDMSKCTSKRTIQGQILSKSDGANSRIFCKLYKTSGTEYSSSEYNAALVQLGGSYQSGIFGGCINTTTDISQFYINVPINVDKVRVFFTGDRLQGFNIFSLNTNATIINTTGKWNNSFAGNRKSRLSLTASGTITNKHDIVNFPSSITGPFSVAVPDFAICRGKIIEYNNNSTFNITLTGTIGSSSNYVLRPKEKLELYASGTNWGVQKTSMVMTTQAASTATTVAEIVADFNAHISNMKTSGLMP